MHRGLETHETDWEWLRERALKAIRFFETDLRAHFEAEEAIVFPAMSGIEEADATIAQLIGEHRALMALVDRLRQTPDLELSPLLREFADLLASHPKRRTYSLSLL